MGKRKKYPMKFKVLVHELLLLVDKENPHKDWITTVSVQEKMTATIFCFVANETRKLRKKINQLESAQFPFDKVDVGHPEAKSGPQLP